MKKRTLINKELAKTFTIELEGKGVRYQTLKNGKGREYKKDFSNEEDAVTFFRKKQWEMLKKGFVLYQKTSDFGEPKLHHYIGGAYTGALSFTHTHDFFFVYEGNEGEDAVKVLSYEGETLDTIKTPDMLAWDMKSFNDNTLLLDLDHHIYSYDIQAKTFDKLSDAGNSEHFSSSCIAALEPIMVYCNNEQLIVKEDNKILLSHDLTFDEDYLDSPSCVAISKDKKMLALHSKSGVIEIIDIYNNKTRDIVGGFGKVEKLQFAESDKTLIIQEKYLKPLVFVDVETGEIKDYPNLQIPEYQKGVSDFCLNDDETNLVLTDFYGQNAYVFDFKSKAYLGKVDIEHAVKTIKIQFVKDDLGVRTDYGCFSLYRI